MTIHVAPWGRYELVREGVLRSLDRGQSYLVASVTGGFPSELREETQGATSPIATDASKQPPLVSSSELATDPPKASAAEQSAALRASGAKDWGASLVDQWLSEATLFSTAHLKDPTSWPPRSPSATPPDSGRSPTSISPASENKFEPPTEVASASPATPREMDAAISSTGAGSAASGSPSTTEAPTPSGATTAGTGSTRLRASDGHLFGGQGANPSASGMAGVAADGGHSASLRGDDSGDFSSRPMAPDGPGCCPSFMLGHDRHDPICEVGGRYVPRTAKDWEEEFSYRAAVLQYEGGFSRQESELRARKMIGERPT